MRCFESEHNELERVRGLNSASDVENPWQRYSRAEISLAYNPFWSSEHKSLIERAGLKVA
jgi:hypothetical protein